MPDAFDAVNVVPSGFPEGTCVYIDLGPNPVQITDKSNMKVPYISGKNVPLSVPY